MRIDLPLSRAVYTASRWHSALEASTGCEPLIGASPLENKGKNCSIPTSEPRTAKENISNGHVNMQGTAVCFLAFPHKD